VPGSLFDSNAWIAVLMPAHPQHSVALQTLRAATPQEPAVFCRSTQQSLLRLLTTTYVLKAYNASAFTNRDALVAVDSLVALPYVVELDEPKGTATRWKRLATCDTASPNVWMDAYLAAFAITHRLRLVSVDRDFLKYVREGLDFQLLK
jgi:uncharacterized protein